jgi:hypothetical protein
MERTSGEARAIDLATWLRKLAEHPELASVEVARDEESVLLELAGIAAHRSVRVAAPITTFIAGVAFGSLPPGERLARLQDLVRSLDLPADDI